MSSLTLVHPRLLAEQDPRVSRPLVVLPRLASPCLAAVPVTHDGVHPGAIGIALAGYGVFLAASWVGWGYGYTGLLMGIITFLSIMYFGLLVGGGMAAAANRDDRTRRSFRSFANGYVETSTGVVSGRNALVQICFMPILLGFIMCVFAAIWLLLR